MTWEDLLRSHGINPDALDAGDHVYLSDPDTRNPDKRADTDSAVRIGQPDKGPDSSEPVRAGVSAGGSDSGEDSGASVSAGGSDSGEDSRASVSVSGSDSSDMAGERADAHTLHLLPPTPASLFEVYWNAYGDPSFVYQREYRFAQQRRFAADYAFVEKRVLVEIEGMMGGGAHVGRHRSLRGYMADCEKYNLAAMNGFVVYRIPTLWLADGKFHRASQVIADLVALLRQR